jgi:hypothetical protein
VDRRDANPVNSRGHRTFEPADSCPAAAAVRRADELLSQSPDIQHLDMRHHPAVSERARQLTKFDRFVGRSRAIHR